MTDFKPQKNFEARQKAKGFIRVSVWVPEVKRTELSKYASKLRRASAKS